MSLNCSSCPECYENITITVQTGLAFQANDFIQLYDGANAYIYGSIVSYDPITGVTVITPCQYCGEIGAITGWTISLSGIPGVAGSSGTSGTSGTSATSGTDGTSGSSGTSGSDGTSGTTGTSGTSGTDGTSGTSGTSGTDGTSGTSGGTGSSGTSGTSGTAGTAGSPGTSGSSGTSGSTPANQITGTGTINTLPKFTTTSTIGDSLFTDNGTNGGFGGANYSSGTDVRTFNISAPLYAGLGFWVNNVQAADIFAYSVTGNLILNADPLNVFSSSNLLFNVDGVTKLTIPSTGAATFTVALSGTSASFSSSVTATAFIPTVSTVPTNGMYSSVANTLNFATNSGSRMSIGVTGSVTMVSTLSLGNYLVIGNANTFIYGGTTVGSIQYGNSTSSTHLKTYGATHATLANVIQLTNNSVVSLTLAATGAATFASTIAATSASFSATSQFLDNTGASTTTKFIRISNTSGDMAIGVEGSTPSQIASGSGGIAYSTVLKTVSTTALILGTNSIAALTINGSTQAATFSSSITAASSLTLNNAANPSINFVTNTTVSTTMFSIIGASYVGSPPFNANKLVASNSSDIAFEAGGSERMRITSGGDVQINATGTALAKLHIGGALNSTMLILRSSNNTGTSIAFTSSSAGGSDNYSINHTIVHNGGYQIEHNVTSRWIRMIAGTGGVELAGAATSWTSISDIRQKDVLETGILNAIDKIKTIDAIYFKYKNEEILKEGEEIPEIVEKGIPSKIKQRRIGLIAQQIIKILPEAVTYNEGEDIYRLSHTDIIPLLIEAIKELKAEIDILKNK
jgi:hypothetical protein